MSTRNPIHIDNQSSCCSLLELYNFGETIDIGTVPASGSDLADFVKNVETGIDRYQKSEGDFYYASAITAAASSDQPKAVAFLKEFGFKQTLHVKKYPKYKHEMFFFILSMEKFCALLGGKHLKKYTELMQERDDDD